MVAMKMYTLNMVIFGTEAPPTYHLKLVFMRSSRSVFVTARTLSQDATLQCGNYACSLQANFKWTWKKRV